MKLLSILLILIPLNVFAPDRPGEYLLRPEPCNGFEPLVKAIVAVECDNDHTQFNLKEQAVGAFQIRPIRIKDFNDRTGSNYKLYECFDYELSRTIFLYYANRIGYPEFEKIARSWNGKWSLTENYWKRVKKYL